MQNEGPARCGHIADVRFRISDLALGIGSVSLGLLSGLLPALVVGSCLKIEAWAPLFLRFGPVPPACRSMPQKRDIGHSGTPAMSN